MHMHSTSSQGGPTDSDQRADNCPRGKISQRDFLTPLWRFIDLQPFSLDSFFELVTDKVNFDRTLFKSDLQGGSKIFEIFEIRCLESVWNSL